ncbi:MAG: hypothetical protein KAS39_07455, partial [Actinomycetia bacterium]|nr:hypothetical protein [Actinomycetes bacterium]
LRPEQYYGTPVHINCERFRSYKTGFYANSYGDSRTATIGGVTGNKPCLYYLGCQGLYTNAPCSRYGWNTGVADTYCMKAGMNCIGCSEPGFPDRTLKTVY